MAVIPTMLAVVVAAVAVQAAAVGPGGQGKQLECRDCQEKDEEKRLVCDDVFGKATGDHSG